MLRCDQRRWGFAIAGILCYECQCLNDPVTFILAHTYF